ncbi:tyrosine-type recombinase/integrase [Clostridium cellulovorans]|uniref:Integrase family protein n=1 Tax=Clostridium cellulovorans (strain ATCC 35296 / DSM 3052 / OCM 3 / 743B) TaxID=573061 RepID=D9SQ35_CLOC7|nr:site-specific integrase [Clostridium cellulovorans]ADL52171.1 integrase family protein [Clostridium cellulovorans 743B]
MAVKTNYAKNGTNYYRITASVGKDSNGKLIRKEFYGKSKKDAEEKRDEYLNGLGNGLNHDYEKTTLGTLIKTWLYEVVRISNKIKPTTFSRYEGVFRNYIETSELYSLRLGTIKSIQIQRYYNNLYDSGKTTSSIKYLNKLMKQFFNYAVDGGYMLKNPCDGKKIVIPGEVKSETEDELEYFSGEEIEKLKLAANDHSLKGLILVALGTGLRRGELLGMDWSDIDKENLTISIERTVIKTYIIDSDGSRVRKNIVQIPKTKTSIRTVSFPEKLLSIFEEVKAKQDEYKARFPESFAENEFDFVFTSSTGNLLDSTNISHSWDNLLEKNNIPHKKFHALRHTFATQLFSKGIPTEVVSKLLGHSDPALTRKIYIHVIPEQRVSSIAILNELF